MDNTSSPEILAPGGNAQAVKAAILAGADAVYLGLPKYNARASAQNITIEDLEELVPLAHSRGTSVYLTLNTLLSQSELKEALELAAVAAAKGIDAVIVQDFGLLKLIRTHLPSLAVHASTQMTTYDKGKIKLLAEMGVSRINLSRELSLTQIKEMADFSHSLNMGVEVFVHGAYCYSFSGQCFMSSFMGGASANRGSCFQPCRRSYTLRNSNIDEVLSLKDNNAVLLAEDIRAAGVDAVKIEGRLKDFFYVYKTVRTWKRVLAGDSGIDLQAEYDGLRTVFNRDFDSGYLTDTVGNHMRCGKSYDRSNQYAGKILSYDPKKSCLALETKEPHFEPPVDVIVIDDQYRHFCSGTIEAEMPSGGYHFKITSKIDGRISRGFHLLIKPDDTEKRQIADAITQMNVPMKMVSVLCSGSLGGFLKVRYSWGGYTAEAVSSIPLEQAARIPVDEEKAREHLCRLGGTGFSCGEFIWQVQENVFIPVSELNHLRRTAVDTLIQLLNKDTVSELTLPGEHLFPEAGIDRGRAYRDSKIAVILTPSLLKTLSLSVSIPAADLTSHIDELLIHVHSEKDLHAIENSGIKKWIPYFDAVIPYSLQKEYSRIIEKNEGDTVACDNPGFAKTASSLGKRTILGPYANITNGHAITALSEFLDIPWFSPSLELNRKQLISCMNYSPVPARPLIFGIPRLLVTHQCMLKDGKKCDKSVMNTECFRSCRGSTVIQADSGRLFHIEKEINSFPVLLNHEVIWAPQMYRGLNSRNEGFLLDFRHLEERLSSETIGKLLLFTLTALHRMDSDEKQQFPVDLLETTTGHYKRGLK